MIIAGFMILEGVVIVALWIFIRRLEKRIRVLEQSKAPEQDGEVELSQGEARFIAGLAELMNFDGSIRKEE